jgi:hypothetical protein
MGLVLMNGCERDWSWKPETPPALSLVTLSRI